MSLKVRKFGKFKLLKPLAKGGMAEIFLGVSGNIKNIHKFVALKRILLSHSHNREFNKMFQNEGKIASNLNHSNICAIHEFGVVENQYFICMEYVAGRNLRQLLQKLKTQKKELDIVIGAYIIKCVCSGLDYAHNCTDNVTGQLLGIIHRDISPQNVMVSFNGDVKVIDFGIAKVDNSEATKVGVLKGKYEYMSPEQATGKKVDRKTDIFSVGIILWELLTGKKLFTGKNEIQILKKIRDCQIPDIKKFNPDVHKILSEILNKSLNANKNLRYQTAAQMEQDLALFLNKIYPNFTQTHFNEFIKKLYIEEIVEERKNLKHYSQFLIKEDSKKLASRSKSRDREESIDSSSTFLGYHPDLNKDDDSNQDSINDEPLTMSVLENNITESTKTQEQFKDTLSSQITGVKFDDSLGGKKYTNSESYTVKSDGYNNQLSFKSNSSSKDLDMSYSGYNPFSGKKFVKAPRNIVKKKKLLNRKAIKWLSIFGLIGLIFYGFQEKTKDLTSKKLGETFFNKLKEFEVSKAKSPAPEKLEPSLREPTASVSLQKKIYNQGKNVFVVTQPSGARIYIDNKVLEGLTPTSVVIPLDRDSQLTLKRMGYKDKTVVLSPKGLKRTINLSLTKLRRRKTREAIIIR